MHNIKLILYYIEYKLVYVPNLYRYFFKQINTSKRRIVFERVFFKIYMIFLTNNNIYNIYLHLNSLILL